MKEIDELIVQLQEHVTEKTYGYEGKDYGHGYDEAMRYCIEQAQQLKASLQLVVPKEVAELYEKNKCLTILGLLNMLENSEDAKIKSWYGNYKGKYSNKKANAQKVLAQIMLYGYTVAKDKLYTVDFIKNMKKHKRLIRYSENGAYEIVEWRSYIEGLVEFMFTESEIKAIDERYWQFAEEVEEGE